MRFVRTLRLAGPVALGLAGITACELLWGDNSRPRREAAAEGDAPPAPAPAGTDEPGSE